MTAILRDVAYSYGVQAFKRGAKRIPAHDKALLHDCIATTSEIGQGIPYLDAWLRGWDDANLGHHN